MLNTMQKWCSKWRLLINDSKSNVIHFRKARSKRSEHRFTFGKVNLEYVNCYKYLGLPLYEDMDFQKTAKMLADSASRAVILNRGPHDPPGGNLQVLGRGGIQSIWGIGEEWTPSGGINK